jgi:hypothetical protein
LDGALKAAAKLVVEMHLELDEILGSVGVNDGMASLLQNVSKCFDWGSLARQVPSADHVLAFREVASVMEPLMRLTDYPVHADFQDVSSAFNTWCCAVACETRLQVQGSTRARCRTPDVRPRKSPRPLAVGQRL